MSIKSISVQSDLFTEQGEASSTQPTALRPSKEGKHGSSGVGDDVQPSVVSRPLLERKNHLTTRPAKPQRRDALYLSDLQVAERFGVSRPTIWRWLKCNPLFPAPVSLSPGCTRWRLSDLLVFEEHVRTHGLGHQMRRRGV